MYSGLWKHPCTAITFPYVCGINRNLNFEGKPQEELMENTVNFKENAFRLTKTSIHCYKLFISIETSISRQNYKGELQRENKLISYERAVKMMKNDMYIAGIGHAVLELLSY